MDHLVGACPAADRGVAALADDHGVGHPVGSLDSKLRSQRRHVVERRHQCLRAALLGQEAPQLRLRLEKVTAGIELGWRRLREVPLQAWERRSGVLMPVRGTATWKLAAGDLEYYRWEIPEVNYNRAALEGRP